MRKVAEVTLMLQKVLGQVQDSGLVLPWKQLTGVTLKKKKKNLKKLFKGNSKLCRCALFTHEPCAGYPICPSREKLHVPSAAFLKTIECADVDLKEVPDVQPGFTVTSRWTSSLKLFPRAVIFLWFSLQPSLFLLPCHQSERITRLFSRSDEAREEIRDSGAAGISISTFYTV